MDIKNLAKSSLDKFEKDNLSLSGKAYLTSGDRSVEEQIDIILDPKRKDNYLNVKERFKSKYGASTLPSRTELTEEQLQWWQREVNLQAGKSPGFPHVGGHAQDISVKNLTTEEKNLLKKQLEKDGCSILMEKVTGDTSEYGVSLENANVFHVTSGL